MQDELDPTAPLFDQGYGSNNPSSLDPFAAPIGSSDIPANPVPLTTGLPGVSPIGQQASGQSTTQSTQQRTAGDNLASALGAGAKGGLVSGGDVGVTTDSGQAIANTVETGFAGAATGAAAGAAIGSGLGLPGAVAGGVIGLVAGGVNAYFNVKQARAQRRAEEAAIAKAQARQDARDAQARQDAIGQLAYNRRQTALQNLQLTQQNALKRMNDLMSQNQEMKANFIKIGR